MQRDRDRLINDAVLYAAAFVVCASAVWVATLAVGDIDASRTFIAALAAGFAVSWFARRYELARRYALLGTAALAGAALFWYARTGTFLGQPLDALIGPDRQLGLAMLLVGLVIVRSYGLVRVEDLLFSVVPTLAIFGVLGSRTFDPDLMVAFVIYAFAAAYLAGQSHLMAERESSRMPPGEDARRVARNRFVLLTVLFGVALGAALPVARAAAALIPGYGREAPLRRGTAAAEREGGGGGRPVWTDPRSLPVGAGPIRLSREVVMRVTSAQPLDWRAGSLSQYTGQMWRASEGLSARVTPRAGGVVDLRSVVNAPPGPTVSQKFEFVGIQGNLLFAAMQPIEVRPPQGGVFVDPAGSIYAARGRIRRSESYEVVSQVDNLRPQGGPSVLAADDPELLMIPNSARQVDEFAKEAVGDITDPEAQVAAIVGWVQARATYSLDAPETPVGEDAVIYFLTRSRVGYCDLFASAAALMCRAVGIPARVAVGYASGEYDRAAGDYVVRAADSHSWVEAYLPDAGWVTVEASPATGGAAPTTSRRTWLTRASAFINRYLLYVLAGLAALAWAALTIKGRWLDEYVALRRLERELGAQGYRGTVILLYDKLSRALARRGLRRRESETPNEYLRRLARNAYLATIVPAVGAMTNEYLAARFSAREIGAEQAAAAQQAVRRATESLRRIKTLK